MMKSEFEQISGRTVTPEQYHHIEQLYLDSTMNKYDFIKSIKGMLKTIPEQVNYPVLVMAVHNQYGDTRTPNHAYYMTVKVNLINVDIRTGKRTVKVIPNSFECMIGYDISDWDHNIVVIK